MVQVMMKFLEIICTVVFLALVGVIIAIATC